jgi:hypothetical protein
MYTRRTEGEIELSPSPAFLFFSLERERDAFFLYLFVDVGHVCGEMHDCNNEWVGDSLLSRLHILQNM